MTPRERLPSRRRSTIIDTIFRGAAYSVVFSRFSDGRVAELFVEPHKIGSHAAEDSRDLGFVISLALQHGLPLAAMRAAVSRVEGGLPASLSGHVIDCLASCATQGHES